MEEYSLRKEINIDEWKRKEHYHFFMQFEEPFHGVMVDMNITKLLINNKLLNEKLTSIYLHRMMVAINKTSAFKLRILDNKVFEYGRIDMGMTILKADETFVYSYTEFDYDYLVFKDAMKKEFALARNSDVLRRRSSPHQIHGSVLPWISFNGLSHARWYSRSDSHPKLTLGKIHMKEGHSYLPLAIHVHHALVDGIDVAKFITTYQELLDQ